MEATPLATCLNSHENGSAHALVTGGTQPSSHDNSGCKNPAVPEHNESGNDCATTCMTMMGCSALSFVAESALDRAAPEVAPAPSLTLTPHTSRSLAPDLPPPRV